MLTDADLANPAFQRLDATLAAIAEGYVRRGLSRRAAQAAAMALALEVLEDMRREYLGPPGGRCAPMPRRSRE